MASDEPWLESDDLTPAARAAGAAARDALSAAAALLSERRINESTETEPVLLRSRSR